MKKFVINIFQKSQWFIKEFGSIIGGVILTNYLTIIQFLTQTLHKQPPKDEIYAIDLAINILIAKGAIVLIFSFIALIYQILFCTNEINLKFEDNKRNSSDKVEYSFNQEISKVFIRVYVKGNPKRLRKCKVELNLPINVTVQSLKPKESVFSITNNKKTIIIDINELTLTKRKWSDSFTLEMIILKSDENINSEIEVVHTPKLFMRGKRNNNIGVLGE
ncbi:hypothetical protein ACWEYI_00030 [Staphylococcus xylosus]